MQGIKSSLCLIFLFAGLLDGLLACYKYSVCRDWQHWACIQCYLYTAILHVVTSYHNETSDCILLAELTYLVLLIISGNSQWEWELFSVQQRPQLCQRPAPEPPGSLTGRDESLHVSSRNSGGQKYHPEAPGPRAKGSDECWVSEHISLAGLTRGRPFKAEGGETV